METDPALETALEASVLIGVECSALMLAADQAPLLARDPAELARVVSALGVLLSAPDEVRSAACAALGLHVMGALTRALRADADARRALASMRAAGGAH
jgi:hypothetical protein